MHNRFNWSRDTAYVCENAATVVEEITSALRTHFTTRRGPSDVGGVTRTVIRSETHFLACSFASTTPDARARRVACESDGVARCAEFNKRAKVKLIRGLSR